MKKKVHALMLAVCLALTLAIPAYALDITEEPIVTPSNPAHPYAPSPGDTDDPDWTSGGSDSTHQFITANAITIVRNAYPSSPLSKLVCQHPENLF